MIEQLAQTLVDMIFHYGYIGIFILMSIESSFIPFPSEIVLIPAGYLASQEKMDLFWIFLSGTAGSLTGAFINYILALSVGRSFLLRYGRYLFIKPQSLNKMEIFFKKHGAISTFNGRLLPGIRQLISIPAGLSKMDLKIFTLYTFLGAGIWNIILIALGYLIGDNQELIKEYLHLITLGVLVVVGGLFFWHFKNTNN